MALVDFRSGMKADSTLTQAAQNAAMAGVPKDLTGIFDGIADHYERGMEKLGAGLAQAAQVAIEAGGVLAKEAIKRKKYRDAAGDVNEKYKLGMEDQLKHIKDIKKSTLLQLDNDKIAEMEFTAPNGEKKKFATRGEARRYAKKMEDNLYASLSQMETTFDQMDMEMTNPNSSLFVAALAAGGGEVKDKQGNVIGSATVGFDEEGMVVFSMLDADGNVKLDQWGRPMQGGKDDLEKLLVVKNPKSVEALAKSLEPLYKAGKQGMAFEKDAVINNVNSLVQSENDLLALMNSKWGNMSHSFMESLSGKGGEGSVLSAEMFNLLTQKFNFPVDTHDFNEDGKVDYEDFPDNAQQFISVITDRTNPQFDLLKSRSIFANWVADNPAKEQYTKGKTVWNAAQTAATNKANQTPKFNQFEYSTRTVEDEDNGGRNAKVPGDVIKNIWNNIKSGKSGDWERRQDGSWSDGTQVISGTQYLELLSSEENLDYFDFTAHADFTQFKGDAGYNENFDPAGGGGDEGVSVQDIEDIIDISQNDADIVKDLQNSDLLKGTGYTFDSTWTDLDEYVRLVDEDGNVTKLPVNKNLASEIHAMLFGVDEAQALLDKYK